MEVGDMVLRLLSEAGQKAAYLSELLLDELNAEEDAEEIAYYTSAEVFFLYAPRKMYRRGRHR